MRKYIFLLLVPFILLSCLGDNGDDTDVTFGIPNPPSPNCQYCIPPGALFVCEEIEEALNLINQIREEVGVSPLEWDCQLAEAAQSWAEYLAENGLFEHEKTSPYGENIFIAYGFVPTLVDAIEYWYKEKNNFDPTDPNWCDKLNEVGHYTQLVWRNTTKIGCGMAKYQKKYQGVFEYVIVCKFDPPGNICDEMPY